MPARSRRTSATRSPPRSRTCAPDKAALRSQLDTAEQGTTARDEFTVGEQPQPARRAPARTRRCASSCSPAPTPPWWSRRRATLAVGGRGVGSTTSVQDAWVDPDKADLPRHAAASSSPARSGSPVEPDRGCRRRRRPRRAPSLAKAGCRRATGAAAALEGSRTGDLVELHTRRRQARRPRRRRRRDRHRVGLRPSARTGPPACVTSRPPSTRAAAGAVLVAPSRSAATDATSVVATARDDGDAVRRAVAPSTTPRRPMGQASVVFGLLEQSAGKAGQYGLAVRTPPPPSRSWRRSSASCAPSGRCPRRCRSPHGPRPAPRDRPPGGARAGTAPTTPAAPSPSSRDRRTPPVPPVPPRCRWRRRRPRARGRRVRGARRARRPRGRLRQQGPQGPPRRRWPAAR